MTAGKNDSHDHHYVPQFFLRNFASDESKKKVACVTKNGSVAVWRECSIRGMGFEPDFYVHTRNGAPVSVETDINQRIETPFSKTSTWDKIKSNRADALDRSDKVNLYALIRHLEVRTPHYLKTQLELGELAASGSDKVLFTKEERALYARSKAKPEIKMAEFNLMASTLEWSVESFFGCGLSIFRSPIRLRSSSTPVHAIRAPYHPALYLPLPGMIPYQLLLTLNPYTIASLMLGNFEGGFFNAEISEEVAHVFNRHFVAQFSHFDSVRHLITDRAGLSEDMAWAKYDLIEEAAFSMKYRRRMP